MSILWCGGEEIDFPNGVPVSAYTYSGFRSSYARCSLASNNSNRTIFYSNSIGSISYPCWLSAQVYLKNYDFSAYDTVAFGLVDTSGKGLILSKHLGKASLDTWDGASFSNLTTESGETFTPSVNGLYKIDMYVEDYDTNVNVKVYIDSVLIIDFTGDITGSGAASLTCFASGGGGSSSNSYVSEFILADEDTRNMSLKTLAPNASGDSNDWTNDYDAIDEEELDDADLMYDNAVNDQALVNLTGMPAGSFQIKAVKLTVRASRTSDSTPTSLNLGVKSGGSVDVADNHSLSTTWESFERLMTVNPITTSAFSSSEIDALQLALKAAA